MRDYKKIVITGGPCGGKTTGMPYISEKLMDYGFSIIVVPEIASMIGGSGAKPGLFSGEKKDRFGEIALKTQLLLEDNTFNQCVGLFNNPKKVMLCDRGAMDVKAYTSPDFFKTLLKKYKLSAFDLRDKRYDGVCHLETAAVNAKKFYTLENNPSRFESPEEAIIQDFKIKNAWIGHNHLKIISSSEDFKEKMRNLLKAVCRMLGIPAPLEIERKFLLKEMPDIKNLPVPVQHIRIEQIYIEGKKSSHTRIRKRSQGQRAIYYLAQKIGKGMIRVEKESIISPKQYFVLKKNQIAGSSVIIKDRYCFIWENQYFELDYFLKPRRKKGLALLEVELTEENQEVALPSFLAVAKEVTKKEKYSNFNISTMKV
jgi:CYTH domain-containing protein